MPSVLVSFIDQLFCLDSLEIIRQIKDQTCPYLAYHPIEKQGNRVDDILLEADRDVILNGSPLSEYGVSYQFKPYE